jgi:hypothetical protein
MIKLMTLQLTADLQAFGMMFVGVGNELSEKTFGFAEIVLTYFRLARVPA